MELRKEVLPPGPASCRGPRQSRDEVARAIKIVVFSFALMEIVGHLLLRTWP